MATLARADMITRVLEALGIVAAGQAAATADSTLAGEVVDSAHARLQKIGLAPYATSAFPEWAQVPFRDYAAYDLSASFGIVGERLQDLMLRRREAERQMCAQMQAKRHPRAIEVDDF